MDERGNNPEKPTRKHLHPAANVARATEEAGSDTDLTRHQADSNGIRVNGIYFGVISLVAIVGLLVIIAVAGAMMMM